MPNTIGSDGEDHGDVVDVTGQCCDGDPSSEQQCADDDEDPSNEWGMTAPLGNGDLHDIEAPGTIATPATTGTSIQPTMRTTLIAPVPSSSTSPHTTPSSVLTVMPRGPAHEVAQKTLDATQIVEYAIDLNDARQVDDLCDDTAFKSAACRIKELVNQESFTVGLFAHPGMSIDANIKHESKEKIRRAAALLLRTVTLIAILLAADRRILWLVPWPSDSDESILDSTLVDKRVSTRLASHRYP